MKNWLKFFFGSFFSNKITVEGAKHNFANGALGFILSFFIILVGLVCGNIAALPAYYNSATEFRQFIDKAFETIDIKVEDNAASSSKKINTVAVPMDKEDYSFNGYSLIVDMSDITREFCEFEITAVNGTNTLAYPDYKNLNAEAKKDYSLKLELMPTPADTSDTETYIEFLKERSDVSSELYDKEIAENYNKLIQKKSELSDEDYVWHLYWLYNRAYYPELRTFGYQGCPSMRDYYTSVMEKEDKYLCVFSDLCAGQFESRGVTVDFNGYYTELDGFDNATNPMDNFIKGTFKSGNGMIWMVYVLNLLQIFPYALILWIILSIITMVVCRAVKMEFGKNIFNDFTVVGSNFFFSSVFAAILSFVLSFFVSRSAAYASACITFYALFALRVGVLLVCEGIKQSKANKIKAQTELK